MGTLWVLTVQNLNGATGFRSSNFAGANVVPKTRNGSPKLTISRIVKMGGIGKMGKMGVLAKRTISPVQMPCQSETNVVPKPTISKIEIETQSQ